jgi:hypothetical protein
MSSDQSIFPSSSNTADDAITAVPPDRSAILFPSLRRGYSRGAKNLYSRVVKKSDGGKVARALG